MWELVRFSRIGRWELKGFRLTRIGRWELKGFRLTRIGRWEGQKGSCRMQEVGITCCAPLAPT